MLVCTAQIKFLYEKFNFNIPGKVVSCGAIVLYCLNLPPEVHYSPENIFIVGLIPPPYSPDPVTISHTLDPMVTKILDFQYPGKRIITYRHPEGVAVQARIVPVIADLQAIRKVGEFLAPSAEFFCSFCDCSYGNLDSIDLSTWSIWDSSKVLQQAQEWLSLNTKVKRKAFSSATGVRWTPLHHLPLWDPVKNLILGFMHNWLEGVLEHQLRTLWGIGHEADKAKAYKEAYNELIADETFTQEDVSESDSELEELQKEAVEWEAAQAQSRSSTLSGSDHTP